jgi:biopolymer transport protein ExbB
MGGTGRGWWGRVGAVACLLVVALALPAWAQDAAARSETESFLKWAIRASGPIGAVILGMSFYLVALVIQMSLEYRKSVAVPERLVRALTDLLAQKRYTDAFNRLATEHSSSFLGRVLSAGVRKLPSGFPAAQRAMELVTEDVTMEMEHRTTYLATVGTLGPMIGLVGTVYGMIVSFQAMATGGASPDAAKLAAGIGTALFATLEGIAVSIPAIAFYSFFRNRIARLSLEVEMAAEPLLEQFAPGIRTPHPLATSATIAPLRTGLPTKE